MVMRFGLSVCVAIAMAVAGLAAGVRDASFASIDQRARNGEPLTVVFFGGSFTWGANATDPQLTSYRGRMMAYLRERYPRAPFTFYDAAIGGTGSDLGVFRLERDVLSRKPDLVFLDFMANDNYAGRDPVTCCFYETLLRRMLQEGIAVEQLYFGFKGQFGAAYNLATVPRRTAYRQLAAAYQVAEGDLFPVMQEALTNGTLAIDAAWSIDGGHPDDAGYAMFFEAAKIGFEAAVKAGLAGRAPPRPLFGEVTQIRRIRLADAPLAKGWRAMKTYRTALWFDGQSSRWMGDVAGCDASGANKIEPLEVQFEGNVIGFFGESSQEGLGLQVRLDGQPLPYAKGKGENWPFAHAHGQGNLFIWRRHAALLPPGKHTASILPAIPDEGCKGQLRIESVCVAELVMRDEK